MRWWQKVIIVVLTVIVIALFLAYWMSYNPMKITVVNERNESINVSLKVYTPDGKVYFNKNFTLERNESINFTNVTNVAANYYFKIDIGNESIKKKVLFYKGHESFIIYIGREIAIVQKN